MHPSDIELISFRLCPFVQRSVIVLLEKGIEFKTTYIDLSSKPGWFLAISPLGKVPVLRVGDETLFESAIINEFLDEITPPSLHPAIPLDKARHRSWIEFSSEAIMNCYRLMMARDRDTFEETREKLTAQMLLVEKQVTGPLFAGSSFCLVDSAFAPLFMRIQLMEKLGLPSLMEECPKVTVWAEQLLARPSVQNSVVSDFDQRFKEHFKESGSYLSGQLFSI